MIADDVVNFVINEIEKLDTVIIDLDIDRAYKSGSPYDNNGRKQQPTLVKFTNKYARKALFKVRKKLNLYIIPELTKRRERLLRYARDKISTDTVVRHFINYKYVDANCNLMA